MEFGDASTTIERYRQALKHILLMLVGMAEMGFGRPLSLVLGEAAVAPRPGRAGRTVRNRPSPALCLPRHLYRAILLILRPAESAARRLIIATAQGIVVTLPPFRPRQPKPKVSGKEPGVAARTAACRGQFTFFGRKTLPLQGWRRRKK